MGKWNVTDPDSGATLVLEGDSPPSEQELEQIFSDHAAQSRAPEMKFDFGSVPQAPLLNPAEQADAASATRHFQAKKEMERIEASNPQWQNLTWRGQKNSLMQNAQRGSGEVLQGAAAALESPAAAGFLMGEDFKYLPASEKQRIREEVARRQSRTAQEQIEATKSNPLFRAGKDLTSTAEETFPVPESEQKAVVTHLTGGAGSFVPLIMSGPAAPLTIGLQSAGAHIDADYDAMIADGVAPEKAAEKTLDRALASGLTQAAIFAVLPKPLRTAGDKYLIDKFAPKLGEKAVTRFIASRAAHTAEGAVLGAGSGVGENVISDRPITENIGESAGGLALLQGFTPRGLSPKARDQAEAFREPRPNFFRAQQQALMGTIPTGERPVTEIRESQADIDRPGMWRPTFTDPNAKPIEELRTERTPDAIQERKAAPIPVEERAQAGPKVGAQVREEKAPEVVPETVAPEANPIVAGETSHVALSQMDDATAAKYFSDLEAQKIAAQRDGVLAGMKLTEADVPELIRLRNEAGKAATKAIVAKDDAAFLANSGKNVWYSGAIEGANRKGPNYDVVNPKAPTPEAKEPTKPKPDFIADNTQPIGSEKWRIANAVPADWKVETMADGGWVAESPVTETKGQWGKIVKTANAAGEGQTMGVRAEKPAPSKKKRLKLQPEAKAGPGPGPVPKWKPIGKNREGQEVFEDERGVRSILEGNIRITEPVSIIPTRSGVETGTGDRTGTRFEVAPPAPAPKPQPPKKESASLAALRKELKQLNQGRPVAEDMAMNDRGASLDRLEAKISEVQRKIDELTRAEAPEPPKSADLPEGVTQEEMARIRSRLKIADELGLKIEGIRQWVTDMESGDPERQKLQPTPKDTLDAINIAIADKQRQMKPRLRYPSDIDADAKKAAEPPKPKKITDSLSDTDKNRLDVLKQQLRKKLGGGQLGTGPDPEIITIGAEMAGLYTKAGVKKFAEFARNIREELPELWDKLKGQLRAIWESASESHPDLEELSRAEAAKVIEGLDKVEKPKESDKTDELDTSDRPVVPEPTDVAPGLPAPTPAGDAATPESPAPGTGSGSTVGKPGSASGKKPGSKPGSGGRTGAGGSLPSGSGESGGKGGTTPDERPGVAEGARNFEVNAGRDQRPDENLRIQPEDQLAPTSRTARVAANLKAIALSKRIEAEGRQATPEEKRILARYSGWGDTFQVFGMTNIGHMMAGEAYEEIRGGRPIYNVVYGLKEQEAFKNWQKNYAATYDSLKAAMSPEEWDAAKFSSLNAHYTSRDGIRALWNIAERLGWKGGVAVESSAGIGSIIGLTPDRYAGKVHWIGVELDPTTARMLKQIYPKSDIQNVGFEKSLRTENNTADLVMTNFPFGNYDIVDTQHPAYDGWTVHNYFLARSVDVVKPGGLVVAITSRYTMDGAKGKKMRDWLAQRADLIGAIRLPDTAFKESAGTEVVTDILVFRKKSGVNSEYGERFASIKPIEAERPKALKKLETETDAEFEIRKNKPTYVNEYFADHPEMVIGKHSLEGSMYGGDSYTVRATGDRPLGDQIRDAIFRLPEDITLSDTEAATAAESAAGIQTVTGQKERRYLEKDGSVWQVDSQGRLQKPEFHAQSAQVAAAKKLIGIRDAILEMNTAELAEDSTDEAISGMRKKLNELYDAFVKSRGNLGERKNSLISDDPEWPLIAQLEDEVRSPVQKTLASGKKVTRYEITYTKGPMLLRRVNFPRTEPTKADSLRDAVQISVSYRGSISPEYISKLTGVPEAEAREQILTEHLAFENPETGMLDTPDAYLSGFVKIKLAEAKRAAATNPKFQRNVEALEKIQPAPLPAEKIYFKLGSNFIPAPMVQRFLKDVMQVDCEVKFVRAGDETRWVVSDPKQESVANNQKWSAGKLEHEQNGVPGHELVNDLLNLKMTEITRIDRTPDGDRTIKYPKETAAARDMQERIQEEFKKWVLERPEEASETERLYNENFNGLVRREFPVPHFDRFPGASDSVKLRDWQKRGASRAVQEATLLAHSVGTGKTYTIITAAMEMRRLKTAKKPMIVVQNSTLTQFANSFRRLYPLANLLVGDERRTKGDQRKAFTAAIATRDWDAVVIPVSFFERIQNDPAREQAYVAEQLERLEEMIREAEGKNYSPSKKPKSTLGKQLEKVKTRFKNKMKRVLDRIKEKTDDVVTFDQLGVDALLVDEAHHFKRGDFITKMDRIKGLDTNGSDHSMDFYLKTQFIHEKSPERNVILATGTPISNTLAEAWTMLRYIRPKLLKDFNVESFDDFVGTFATSKASIEETPTGGFAQVLRLAKYVNGPEIGQLWRAGADVYVLNREDFLKMGVNVPEIDGGIPTEIIIPRTESVGKFVDFLKDWRLWWDNLDGQDKAESSYVPILQYGLARKAAIDMRMVNPKAADDPGSKINKAIDMLMDTYNDTKEENGTQLVFSNLYRSHDPKKRWLDEEIGLPNPLYGETPFNMFDDMKKKLMARGVPESEIADFTEMSEPQRFAAAEQLNNGTIRIAFGTTSSLGTGLNVQNLVAAIHHLDPQFRPMDFEQRNGRAIRQGNQFPKVKLLVYGMKNTLDSTLYQLMLIKQKFIAQMMTADNLSREFEDPSDDSTMTFQAMAAAFSGNPLYAKRFGLENDVRRLEILNEDFSRKKMEVRNQLADVRKGDAAFNNAINEMLSSREALNAAFPEHEIVSVADKNGKHEGENAKKFLESVYADAYGEMERNLNMEFAAGDLQQSHAKDIADVKKGKWRGDILRKRSRSISINGIPFSLEIRVIADMAELAANNALVIKDRTGSWEVTGKKSASWSDEKPWYVSQVDIHGNASSSGTLQSSIWHSLKLMDNNAERVKPSRERFTKTTADLNKELDKPFESASRLTEQREKLAEVLKELEAHGGDATAQQPPDMDAIVEKHRPFAYLTRKVAAEGSAEIISRIAKEDREKAKKSFYGRFDNAYALIKNGKPARIPGHDWIEVFASEDKKKKTFSISEVTTGARLGSGDTLKDAIQNVANILTSNGEKKVKEHIRDKGIEFGLSPRSQALDASKESLINQFETGKYVRFDFNGESYLAQINGVNRDYAKLEVMTETGKKLQIPMRYAKVTSEKSDIIEATLTKAIEALKPDTGASMEGVTGLPVWLAKDAARIALQVLRAAYKAGKRTAIAIQEAIDYVRGLNLPDFNEKELESWLKKNELKPHQVAGELIGELRPAENIAEQKAAVQKHFFDSNRAVDTKGTARFWELLDEMIGTQRGENADLIYKTVRDDIGAESADMAPGLLKAELQHYALKVMRETGDRSLFEAIINTDRDFAISAPGGRLGSEQSGRELRALQEFSGSVYWKNMRILTDYRDQLAGEESGIGAERFKKLLDTIDQVRLNPDELEAFIRERGELTDVGKPQPDARGKRTRSDENENQRVAESIMDKFEKKQGAEVLIPPRQRNIVRKIIAEFLSTKEPVWNEATGQWEDAPKALNPEAALANNTFKQELADRLMEVDVEKSTAQRLAVAVENRALAEWADRRERQMNRAANRGSIRGLIDEIFQTPYRAQHDPAWRLETAQNWLMSNGLSREQAVATAKQFDAQFRAAMAEAGERAARRVLEGHDPRTVNELVELIRTGLIDPSRPWAETLAERKGWKPLTAEQHAKLVELEARLADPDLSVPERSEIADQMFSIFRTVQKSEGLLNRLAANLVVTNLTSLSTGGVNIFSPQVHGLMELGLASVTSPRDLPSMLKLTLKAGKEWLSQVKYSMQRDAYSFVSNEYQGAQDSLKGIWERGLRQMKSRNKVERVKGLTNIVFGAQQYSMRLLNAIDNANGLLRAQAALGLYTSQTMRQLKFTPNEIRDVINMYGLMQEQFYAQGIENGLSHNQATVRASALASAAFKDFLNDNFHGIGRDLFRARELDAYSVLGRLAPGVKETDEGGLLSRTLGYAVVKTSNWMRKQPGLTPAVGVALFGYVSVPWRAARFMAWNTPYGLLKLGIHAWRKKTSRENWWKQSLATEQQERYRLKQSIAGTAALALLTAGGYAMLKTSADTGAGDDDDTGVYFTGDGPKNKNLRSAWMARGFKSNSLVISYNGYRVAIPLTRSGEALAHIGWLLSARDQKAWRDKEAKATGRDKEPSISDDAAYAVGTYLSLLGQRGPFQTLTQASQAGGDKMKLAASKGSGFAAGLVTPFLGLQRSAVNLMLGTPDQSSIKSVILANLPVVGIVSAAIGQGDAARKPLLNRFGDPLYNPDDSWYHRMYYSGLPIAIRTPNTPENKKFYGLIVDKGAAPPEITRSNIEDKYGDKTDDEWYKFAQTSGKLLKANLQNNLSGLLQMDAPEVKKYINKAASQANRDAATALKFQEKKPPKRDTSEAAYSPSAAPGTGGVAVRAGSISGPAGAVRATRVSSPSLRPVSLSRGRRRLSFGGRSRSRRLVHGRVRLSRASSYRNRSRFGSRRRQRRRLSLA